MKMRTGATHVASLALLSWALLQPAWAQSAGDDAEAATHSDDAAQPQLSFEQRVGPAVIRQYQLGCLSQLTYLIGVDGEAAVVDPQRDVDHYLRDAEALGLTVRYVILTHTNADFVAGHMELRERTGAEILISHESGSTFPHRAVKDGLVVALGSARLTFWATPGHTLDSLTLLVAVPGAPADPVWALTGDALFIGGIGRPDLAGGELTSAVLANHAYASMQRLKTLPDKTLVLPAHGAGSLCGAHLSEETVSTIGEQRASNPFLAERSRASFVAADISGLSPAPGYFAYDVRLNREGPPLLASQAALPAALDVARVQALVAEGAWIIDVRSAAEYGAAHLPGAVNIAIRGRFDTWTGTVVPPGAPIVLVGSDALVNEAHARLKRIGYDQSSYLSGGVDAWRSAGLPLRQTQLFTPGALHQAMQSGQEPLIVDVRTPAEYEQLRLRDSSNLPLNESSKMGQTLDRSQPLLLVCNTAYRSSLAVGLAERQGFAQVGNLVGGLEAWLDAGLPVVAASLAELPTARPQPETPSVELLLLPEPLEARTLARMIQGQSALYEVLDLRPAWQYEEYHLPGAVRVDAGALFAHVQGLPAHVRPVIVDSDGTLAASAAGVLMGRLGETRTVRFLLGGTERYYAEIELAALRPGNTPAARPSVRASELPAQPVVPAAPETAPTPAPRKIPRAGC